MYKKSRARYFFLMPGVVWILAFTFFPLIFSLYLSFTNANMRNFTQATWNLVGFQNYASIGSDLRVGETVVTSLYLTVGSTLLTLILGTFLAWLFNHDLPGLRIFRSILTMPLFAAPIALGFMGLILFNETSGSINSIISAVQNLFQNVVYPQSAITRARGLVGQIMGIYNQIRAIAQTAVNSATLANPRALEQTLLSRNPLQIPNVSANFQSVYQPLPPPTDASPAMRNVIDMSDAAAQAAMKRAIAIDAIADQELRAAEQMLNELQSAAPGTAPMIGAQGAAWLVRAHAYTQAALADSMRLRAIDLANSGAEMKFNASSSVNTRQDTGMMMQRR
ncbi:MAG: sugar ABC transporter permease [Chloroflexi bacterium]|nr:sugar ABC transporter permease [Chloroflexota bacterium]